MFNTGEWVNCRSKDGKYFNGFVIGSSDTKTTVEVLNGKYKPGKTYEPQVYCVPNFQLNSLKVSNLPQDKELYIDLALATNDRGWFESLTGSLASQIN